MANRNLLPKHYLEDFKVWLVEQGHEHRPTTADYQVLQVRLKGKPQWHAVYFKLTGNPHYTVPDPLVRLTARFIRDTYGNHHPAPRQQAATGSTAQAEGHPGDPTKEDDAGPPF